MRADKLYRSPPFGSAPDKLHNRLVSVLCSWRGTRREKEPCPSEPTMVKSGSTTSSPTSKIRIFFNAAALKGHRSQAEATGCSSLFVGACVTSLPVEGYAVCALWVGAGFPGFGTADSD